MNRGAPLNRAESVILKSDLERVQAQDEVSSGMSRCVARLQSGSWLNSTNGFSTSSGPGFKYLKNGKTGKVKLSDLSDYCAAASLLHCTDAWSYLGRATNAFSAGLLTEAAHLAYYSELRSALSILASSGIVMDDFNGYGLDGGSLRPIIQGSSHQIIWALLSVWSSTTGGTDAVGSLIKIENESLAEWLRLRAVPGNTSSTITNLLQEWGVDLKSLSNDRMRRNIASYRPSRLEHHAPSSSGDSARNLMVTQTRNWLIEICRLVEPDMQGSFPNLDAELLTLAIARVGGVGSVTSSIASLSNHHPTSAELKTLAVEVLGSDKRTEMIASRLYNLFSTPSNLVRAASNNPAPSYPVTSVHLEGMLGRAIILARIATGYVNQVQVRAGIKFTDMAPWADNIGLELGFWHPNPRPEPFIDMWADLREGMDDLGENYSVDLATLISSVPTPLIVVTGLTRVALWSLSA